MSCYLKIELLPNKNLLHSFKFTGEFGQSPFASHYCNTLTMTFWVPSSMVSELCPTHYPFSAMGSFKGSWQMWNYDTDDVKDHWGEQTLSALVASIRPPLSLPIPQKSQHMELWAQLCTCRNGICIPATTKILVPSANDNIPLCYAQNIPESQAYSKEHKSFFYWCFLTHGQLQVCILGLLRTDWGNCGVSWSPLVSASSIEFHCVRYCAGSAPDWLVTPSGWGIIGLACNPVASQLFGPRLGTINMLWR